MEPKTRKWLDLGDKDLAPWRALPVSRLLLAWLDEERSRQLDYIANCVASGEDRAAAVASGGLAVIRTLIAGAYPPVLEEPADEEPFVDPASIIRPMVMT